MHINGNMGTSTAFAVHHQLGYTFSRVQYTLNSESVILTRSLIIMRMREFVFVRHAGGDVLNAFELNIHYVNNVHHW